MSEGTVIAISLASAIAVVVVADFTRAKGARMFSRGANGETALLFDPASAPAKK